jgi:hypothetical protein
MRLTVRNQYTRNLPCKMRHTCAVRTFQGEFITHAPCVSHSQWGSAQGEDAHCVTNRGAYIPATLPISCAVYAPCVSYMRRVYLTHSEGQLSQGALTRRQQARPPAGTYRPRQQTPLRSTTCPPCQPTQHPPSQELQDRDRPPFAGCHRACFSCVSSNTGRVRHCKNWHATLPAVLGLKE